MEKITVIQPLQAKILLQAEKFKCIPDSPMKSRLAGYTKNRLKRSSFVHKAKKLDRKFAPELTIPAPPMSSTDILDPLKNDLSHIKVKINFPQLDSGKQECESIRSTKTIPMTSGPTFTQMGQPQEQLKTEELVFSSNTHQAVEKHTIWPLESIAAPTEQRLQHS